MLTFSSSAPAAWLIYPRKRSLTGRCLQGERTRVGEYQDIGAPQHRRVDGSARIQCWQHRSSLRWAGRTQLLRNRRCAPRGRESPSIEVEATQRGRALHKISPAMRHGPAYNRVRKRALLWVEAPCDLIIASGTP